MRPEVQLIPWDAPNFDKEGLMSKCQRCGHGIIPTDSKVLGAIMDDTHLVHATCRGCHGSAMLMVTVNDLGVMVAAMQTDLSYTDCQERVRAFTGVTVDDIIDIHFLLLEKTPGRDFIDDILDTL